MDWLPMITTRRLPAGDKNNFSCNHCGYFSSVKQTTLDHTSLRLYPRWKMTCDVSEAKRRRRGKRRQKTVLSTNACVRVHIPWDLVLLEVTTQPRTGGKKMIWSGKRKIFQGRIRWRTCVEEGWGGGSVQAYLMSPGEMCLLSTEMCVCRKVNDTEGHPPLSLTKFNLLPLGDILEGGWGFAAHSDVNFNTFEDAQRSGGKSKIFSSD